MEIQFLESLFPQLDSAVIQEKLRNGNLDEAVAEILNDEEMDDPEWQDLVTLREMFPDHSEDKIYEIYMETGMQGAVEFFMSTVEDQVHRVVLPKQYTSKHSKQDPGTVEFLHSMFPLFEKLDIERVLTYLESDVDETVSTLSKFSAISLVDPREKLRMELESLQAMFPSISRRKLQQLWTRFGLDGAIDRLTQNAWANAPLGVNLIPDSPVSVYFGKSPEVKTIDTSEKAMVYSKESIMELRRIAHTYLMKRNDCFQRACNVFQKGTAGRAAAGQYASEGHHYTNLMNEANRKAADAIFQQGISRGVDGSQVDLHGLTVREAKERLDLYLESYRGRLKIITGAGHHSSNGGKLFRTMQSWLRCRGFRVEIAGNGWFFITK
jgi:hypothetical protein